MKPLAWTVVAGLLAGTSVIAQPPAKDPPPADPAPASVMSEKNQKFLDAYLKAWEDRMARLEGIETKIGYTETSAEGNKVVRTGDAALLKPNFARMLLKPHDDPTKTDKWMHFSADGKFFRIYDYKARVVRTEQLPKEGVGNDTMLSFLFMTKAADLKKRYDLAIDVDDPKRHTDFYLFIEVRPKTRDDMIEFKKAELVLWKNNKDEKFADRWMLPARLWFQKPNGEQIMWEFQGLSTQKRLLPRDFEAPELPGKDWKPEWLRPPGQPVSRGSGSGR